MSTNPHPILPWHRDAAREIELRLICNGDLSQAESAAIIARHDANRNDALRMEIQRRAVADERAAHAETLRLLEEAYEVVKDYGYGACVLRDEIRAHLAALSKPAACADGKKGSQ